MRNLSMTAMAFVLIAIVQPAAGAEDPTGTWKFTTMLGKKSLDVTLKLKLDGDKLTGTVGGGQGNQEISIADANFKDDKVSFSVTRERNGQKLTQKYAGIVSGDTIKGTVESERDGKSRTSDWEAKRQK